ncbi:MAG: DNA adenine methylase [Gomphosphaeria aponina SAG 52.96 = DSM 107014]|uniref:Site-specific DNA-methyltransferase (adenine-specific) n=1 Tax=Gomphosphaeria aponina SAG 52.96 = DSM 107014 TaxID=1521640 RepID=A0A941GVQ8_9CHRO|nr:DNA adenine methylase [Gomphosphaeria aponina SAG 52.96 = DSM 107014]
MIVKPFLKWAGGKSQLLEQMEGFFPPELKTGLIQRYIEPFVGGGAMFFHLATAYSIDEFFIADINPELLCAYLTIQQNVTALISILQKIESHYLSLDEAGRKEYYYEMRSKFNEQRAKFLMLKYQPEWINRTAQLIFLNRTCFNGLFRVNSKGDFNVPMGRYKNPTICHPENLKAVAQILQKTHIHCGDFTDCRQWVNEQSFVYFDPPYRPISATANFNAYASPNFDDSEQLRLSQFYRELDQKGAKLMLSNSEPKNEDPAADFFEVAYAGYGIERLSANRYINSKGSKRGKINELLIINYA